MDTYYILYYEWWILNINTLNLLGILKSTTFIDYTNQLNLHNSVYI